MYMPPILRRLFSITCSLSGGSDLPGLQASQLEDRSEFVPYFDYGSAYHDGMLHSSTKLSVRLSVDIRGL